MLTITDIPTIVLTMIEDNQNIVLLHTWTDIVWDNDDIEVIITEWDQFRALDLNRVKNCLNGNVVVDLRNIYDPSDMVRRGFEYTSVGRP